MGRFVMIRDSHQPAERLVEESPVLKEAALHEVLMRHPELIPATDLGFGRVATVGTEGGLSSGRADLVLLDEEGHVCIVEVKKEGNPDTRKVVAQLLDYAAALWGLTVDEFERRVLRGKLGDKDPRSLHEFIIDELVPSASDDPEGAADSVLEALGETLRTGDFALVLAAPTVPEGVQRVIEYLNARGHSVFGLEVSYFAGDVEAFVPRIVVRPSLSGRIAGGKQPDHLDRNKLLLRIGEHSPEAVKAAEAVLDWAEGEPRLHVRYAATFAAIETVPAGRMFLRVSQRGSIRAGLHTLRRHEGWDDERIGQLVQDLADIGVHLDPTQNQPKLPVEPLADATNGPRFFELMERTLDTLTGP